MNSPRRHGTRTRCLWRQLRKSRVQADGISLHKGISNCVWRIKVFFSGHISVSSINELFLRTSYSEKKSLKYHIKELYVLEHIYGSNTRARDWRAKELIITLKGNGNFIFCAGYKDLRFLFGSWKFSAVCREEPKKLKLKFSKFWSV